MKSKRYRLKSLGSQMPYEIEVWDPRSDEPMPDWFSDILQVKYFNEHGQPEFKYTEDKEGNLMYYVPVTSGHFHVNNKSIIARDIHTKIIFPIKHSTLNLIYDPKCSSIIRKITIITQTMVNLIRTHIMNLMN